MWLESQQNYNSVKFIIPLCLRKPQIFTHAKIIFDLPFVGKFAIVIHTDQDKNNLFLQLST
jgi:hypothetical protein